MTKPLPIPPQQGLFETTQRYGLSTKAALLEAGIYDCPLALDRLLKDSLERKLMSKQKIKKFEPVYVLAKRAKALGYKVEPNKYSHNALLKRLMLLRHCCSKPTQQLTEAEFLAVPALESLHFPIAPDPETGEPKAYGFRFKSTSTYRIRQCDDDLFGLDILVCDLGLSDLRQTLQGIVDKRTNINEKQCPHLDDAQKAWAEAFSSGLLRFVVIMSNSARKLSLQRTNLDLYVVDKDRRRAGPNIPVELTVDEQLQPLVIA